MGDQKAVERYYGEAKVVVKNYTQATANVGSVASGVVESITINPPIGKLWKVLDLRIVVLSDADATSGNHEVKIQHQGQVQFYCQYRSDYATTISIQRATIRSANLISRPDTSEALLILYPHLIASPDEGLVLLYTNNTDVAQENDREWKLRFLEIPLERAV